MKSILMKTPWIIPLSLGLKDQTRVVVPNLGTSKNLFFKSFKQSGNHLIPVFYNKKKKENAYMDPIPFEIGDSLWVRESAKIISYNLSKKTIRYSFSDSLAEFEIPFSDKFFENNNPKKDFKKWVLNSHKVPGGCLEEMARYHILIKDISIQKIFDISEDDIKAEGYSTFRNGADALSWFKKTWNSTSSKKDSFSKEPFVTVYAFTVSAVLKSIEEGA